MIDDQRKLRKVIASPDVFVRLVAAIVESKQQLTEVLCVWHVVRDQRLGKQFLMPQTAPRGMKIGAGAVGDRPERLFTGQFDYSTSGTDEQKRDDKSNFKRCVFRDYAIQLLLCPPSQNEPANGVGMSRNREVRP